MSRTLISSEGSNVHLYIIQISNLITVQVSFKASKIHNIKYYVVAMSGQFFIIRAVQAVESLSMSS